MWDFFSSTTDCFIFEKAVLQRQVCGKTASVLLPLLWANLRKLVILGVKCDKISVEEHCALLDPQKV